MTSQTPPIILYTYPFSPWGAKVSIYLTLRAIPFSECHQPMTWPRPDLTPLNIAYRRIPLLAIGKDIYYDSSLIIQKLEKINPPTALGKTDPSGKALDQLLEKWVEGSIFKTVTSCLPSDLPLMGDAALLRDRKELWGLELTPALMEVVRPKALVEMRDSFALLEGLLGEGRVWLQGGEKAGLADLHAAFLLDWVLNMPGALPDEFFSAAVFPHTRTWLEDYKAAVQTAQSQSPPTLLQGPEAANLILGSEFSEPEGSVVADPTGLRSGQVVSVYRSDDLSSSVKHRDVGRLVGLNVREIVVAVKAQAAETEIRVHCPRLQFNVEAVEDGSL